GRGRTELGRDRLEPPGLFGRLRHRGGHGHGDHRERPCNGLAPRAPPRGRDVKRLVILFVFSVSDRGESPRPHFFLAVSVHAQSAVIRGTYRRPAVSCSVKSVISRWTRVKVMLSYSS